jgi:hypothetical protein
MTIVNSWHAGVTEDALLLRMTAAPFLANA